MHPWFGCCDSFSLRVQDFNYTYMGSQTVVGFHTYIARWIFCPPCPPFLFDISSPQVQPMANGKWNMFSLVRFAAKKNLMTHGSFTSFAYKTRSLQWHSERRKNPVVSPAGPENPGWVTKGQTIGVNKEYLSSCFWVYSPSVVQTPGVSVFLWQDGKSSKPLWKNQRCKHVRQSRPTKNILGVKTLMVLQMYTLYRGNIPT